MATTAYGVNHPLAVKLWSRKLFHEALKQTWFSRFVGTTSNSLVQVLEDTSKGPGDRIRQGLRMLLSGNGIQGDGTLEGNEESLVTYYDDVLIDQLRHAVRTDGRMSEQRVPFSLREEARQGLQDWWADRLDTCFFNTVAGNTGVTDTRFSGNNSTIAPSATHMVFAGGEDSEGSLSATTTHAMSVSLIDKCVAKAKTLSPMIRPIRINGADHYVLFMHPYDVYQLRQQAATTGSWADIQKAAIQGGQTSKNPIFNGALGMWNNVILHEAVRLPVVPGQTAFRRSVFAGAQSVLMAFGRNSGPNKMSWVEEKFDYGNQLGVSAGMIFGMKKAQFNSTDFSTITVSTWAPSV